MPGLMLWSKALVRSVETEVQRGVLRKTDTVQAMQLLTADAAVWASGSAETSYLIVCRPVVAKCRG
jgi:hypothetical protein